MTPLSGFLICKDSIATIEDCITALSKVSDEIIVVDTGSTDGTVEWLKDRKVSNLKLYHFDWTNHFSEARNYSMSLCQNDWVFFIDSDEILKDEAIERINNLKANDFEGKKGFLCDNPTESYYAPRLELFDKSKGFFFKGRVHEYVDPFIDGVDFKKDIGHIDTPIDHRTNGPMIRSKAYKYFEMMKESYEKGELTSCRDFYFYSCCAGVLSESEICQFAANKAIELYKKNPEKAYVSDCINSYDQLANIEVYFYPEERKEVFYWNSSLLIKERHDIHYYLAKYYEEMGNYKKAFYHINRAEELAHKGILPYEAFFVQKMIEWYYIPIKKCQIILESKKTESYDYVRDSIQWFLNYGFDTEIWSDLKQVIEKYEKIWE